MLRLAPACSLHKPGLLALGTLGRQLLRATRVCKELGEAQALTSRRLRRRRGRGAGTR